MCGKHQNFLILVQQNVDSQITNTFVQVVRRCDEFNACTRLEAPQAVHTLHLTPFCWKAESVHVEQLGNITLAINRAVLAKLSTQHGSFFLND